MGLAQVQTILARLYTDAEYLERFLESPKTFVHSLGLADADAALFSELSSQQLKRFAQSLKHKRLGEVQKLLPLTLQAFGKPEFNQRFLQFADTYNPTGTKKHLDDALKFVEFLSANSLIEQPHLACIARFEAMCLESLSPNRRVLFRFFRYSIRQLIQSSDTELPTPCPHIELWFRATTHSQWRHFSFSLPSLSIFSPSAKRQQVK